MIQDWFSPLRARRCTRIAGGLASFLLATPLLAQEQAPKGLAWPDTPSLNFYGSPGLIDMPSADMMPDAQFAASVGHFAGQTRMNLQFQALPRMTVAFRYNALVNKNPNQLFFGFETYYDRNFDVRFLFWGEGRYRPAVAIGLQDFAGTGLFGSEYVVATKTFVPEALPGRLKLTAGLGWGRFGSQGSIATYGTRGQFQGGDTGGELSFDQWFRGDIAPFAGVEWTYGKWGVKAEYSSDAYTTETGELKSFERRSSFNFGVEYQQTRQLRLGAYYLYGTTFGVSAQLQMSPLHPPTLTQISAPNPIVPRRVWAPQDAAWSPDWADSSQRRLQVRDQLAEALRSEGLVLESVTLTGTVAEVRVRNRRFRADTLTVGRTARAMSRSLPPSVETFRIVPVFRSQGLSTVVLRRSDLEALEFSPTASDSLWAVAGVEPAGPPAENALLSEGLYPDFGTSISPYASPSYFDPTLPFRLDIGLSFGASYTPAPGWRLAGAIHQRIWGNVAKGRRYPSRLPPVRTGFHEYATYETTLNTLYMERRWQPGQHLYARTTLGYLESMYGGVSGEILWKPVSSPLGLGLEVNYVRQRDYNQQLGFGDYNVLTGHASAYLELDKNYLLQLDAGRYLAGDYGGTVTLVRQFNNGWRLGAFFSITNVSAEDFGEGSFDKGIILTVPLGWLLGKESRNGYGLIVRPVQRDGAQRVEVPGRLYPSIRNAHQRSLSQQRARFWE